MLPMFLRGGSFGRVFMVALALVLAMRISAPTPGERAKVEAASRRPSPFLGKALGSFFRKASDLVLETAGLVDKKVEEKVGRLGDRWSETAEKLGKKFSSWAAGMSRVFYKSSPLYGLKTLGDKACDGLLKLMSRSLDWASGALPGKKDPLAPTGARPPGGVLPGGEIPVPSGGPGRGRG